MSDTIKGSIIGALITGGISLLIFFLGNFSTQSTIEEKTVETLSGYFNSVDKDMSYEQALQTIYKENENLKIEIDSYNSSLNEANHQITELQAQSSQELENMKQQYDNEIQKKYDVDFQNISLILNGISTIYSDKVAIINNETYYSIGFLQYLVNSENISENNKKLFIGEIQSEEQMPISLFDLEPTFSGGYLIPTTDEEDNYGNKYDEAFKVITSTLDSNDLIGVTEYLVDGYSTFSFDIVHSKYADQMHDYEIIVLGDDRQLKSVNINKKTKIQHFEIDISDVEFLQIIGKGGYGGPDWDTFYSLIVNPYLYP